MKTEDSTGTQCIAVSPLKPADWSIDPRAYINDRKCRMSVEQSFQPFNFGRRVKRWRLRESAGPYILPVCVSIAAILEYNPGGSERGLLFYSIWSLRQRYISGSLPFFGLWCLTQHQLQGFQLQAAPVADYFWRLLEVKLSGVQDKRGVTKIHNLYCRNVFFNYYFLRAILTGPPSGWEAQQYMQGERRLWFTKHSHFQVITYITS